MESLTGFFALLAALIMPSLTKTQNDNQAFKNEPSITQRVEVLTPAQRRRADQIISAFENDTTELQYDYTEELDDGRGLTAGRAGFTTGTGDLLLVVQRYVTRVPDSPLKSFLPRLEVVAKDGSGSMDGLEGLNEAWEQAASDPVFRSVQDEVVDELYYQQAVKWWRLLGMHTPLGLLCLYDTVIQHGDGDDPDSLIAIIQRTNEQASGMPASGIEEKEWLLLFLKERRETLACADCEETRAAWAESVTRCDVLASIVQAGNDDLHGPILIQPYGTIFTIE